MVTEDAAEFRNTISGMFRVFGKDPDTVVLDAYWLALKDWKIEEFREASAYLLNHCKFMPKPSEFHDLKNAGEETAGESFANVMQYLTYSPNGYTVDEHTPQKVRSCIAAVGGADAIALCESDKLHFIERRWTEHYREIGDRMQEREEIPNLIQSGDLKRVAGTFKKLGF